MSRYLIILNPIAGKGTALRSLPRIRELLTQHELNFDITMTDYPGHGIEIARKAAEEEFDYVIAAGGDGTANEVLNGLMQNRAAGGFLPVMGIIPVGRGNDFAFGVNIPTALDEACALLSSLPRKWIDIGRVSGGDKPDGMYFGNGIGVGFDAVVGFIAARMKLTGMLSYLIAAFKTIFVYFKPPSVEIKYAEKSLTLPALMVSIMNGRRMGGGFMMAPSASTTDGMLNICMVREVPQLSMFRLVGKFMKGSHEADPAVSTATTDRITVTAKKGVLPVHADGNTVCEAGTEIMVELLPRALEIITRLED